MKSAIYMDGQRFVETEFKLEPEFEKIVKENAKTLFGPKTIYFGIKNKIETKTLGGAIPDGFLFDFREKDAPEFYLVEVELQSHDFDRHIFPQIKKFFSFFKNPKSRDDLIGKIDFFIKSSSALKQEFKKFIGEKEIYKTIKDAIENSQNILLVIDEYKPEFDETSNTITEWAKLVKVEVLKQYTANKKSIFTLNPDFEDISLVGSVSTDEDVEYNESYHLGDVNENVSSIYNILKESVLKLDPTIAINPQKYYISFKKNKSFTFFQIRKKKIHIVIMLPYETGANLIKKHRLTKLTESVQNFWNGPCFTITLDNKDNLDEVVEALKEAYNQKNK